MPSCKSSFWWLRSHWPGKRPCCGEQWWPQSRAKASHERKYSVRSTQLRTFTGRDGGFAIDLPDLGEHIHLIVVAAGFKTVEQPVDPQAAATFPLVISLERTLFEVPGMTVTANRGSAQPGDAPGECHGHER